MASKRKEQYNQNKKAKVGNELICPICGTKFTKKQWQQAFCCGACKDKYWNDKATATLTLSITLNTTKNTPRDTNVCWAKVRQRQRGNITPLYIIWLLTNISESM